MLENETLFIMKTIITIEILLFAVLVLLVLHIKFNLHLEYVVLLIILTEVVIIKGYCVYQENMM